MNGTAGALRWRTINQLVAEALVVPFAVVVRHELGERPMKMPFTERNHAIDAFLMRTPAVARKHSTAALHFRSRSQISM
jgi:hypothetical protein